MSTKLEVGNIFSTAWKAVKSQIWVLAGIMIAYLILNFTISTLYSSLFTGDITVLGVSAYIVNIIISSIFGLGYTKNLFQALDDIEPQISAYSTQARKLLTYLGAGIIYGVIVCIGCVFLILPGIYLALRLQYYMALIVEEDAGVIESLKKSWEITEGHMGFLILLFLANIGIIFLGILLLFLGLFVAMPIVYMMYCASYRLLNPMKSAVEEVEEVAVG
jgi:uncharacterized membrane protein